LPLDISVPSRIAWNTGGLKKEEQDGSVVVVVGQLGGLVVATVVGRGGLVKTKKNFFSHIFKKFFLFLIFFQFF
jgi:hypothetical protein